MTQPKQEDVLLERALSQIRSSQPEPQLVAAAADRVWNRLRSDAVPIAARAAEVVEIRGCDDYQALIPAYLAATLPQARKLLVEDHTRSCIPCRRVLKEAREGKTPSRTVRPVPARRRRPATTTAPQPLMRWALAAMLLVAVGIAGYYVGQVMLFGPGTTAVVRTADADLFQIATASQLPLAAGDPIREGEAIRTGREGGAVVELNDGSLVEMRGRTEIAVRDGRRGTTIDLVRGSVIVQAAPKRDKSLFVATDQCRVAVTGTIFSVNHGTKGSRVAVVEGEVRVNYAGTESILLPGEQVTTNASLDAVPVEKEIGWSRDVDRYVELLREYAELRREIRQTVPRPELRYASRLLDLVPAETVLYTAVPNFGETITETHRLLRERLDQSPVLAEWWQEQQGSGRFEPMTDEIVGRLGEFSEFLGGELVVSGQMSGNEFVGPLVLAEVVDPAGLRDLIETTLAEHGPTLDGVVFLEDPFAPAAAADVYLWLDDDLIAGSPQPAQLARVAEIVRRGAANPFVGTPFYARIAELYEEGVEIVVAANLDGLVETTLVAAEGAELAEKDGDALRRLGLLDLRHLIFEQKKLDKTYHRAVVTFTQARRGLAAWLAPPAPMGSLDFISADAKLVAAFVVKDPALALDDVFALTGDGEELAAQLEALEDRLGLSLRDDFAKALGGEFAFAVDGPLLPKPAWKVIVEVYDPARFQYTVEQLLAELNAHLAEAGKETYEIVAEESGDRTYYALNAGLVEIHYTFADGYLVVASSRALVDRALRFHTTGYGLVDSARFAALLPLDGRNNFSALLYHDLGEVLEAVGQRLSAVAELTPEQEQALDQALAQAEAETGPGLGYAYGEQDRIIVAAVSDQDVMTSMLLRLLGLKNPLGLEMLGGPFGI